MSAFVHDAEHINLLVTALDHYRTRRRITSLYVTDPDARWGRRDILPELSLDDAGRLLLDENVTAVKTRYSDVLEPGEAAEYDQMVDTYRYTPTPTTNVGHVPFPTIVLAATTSYRYQASEDPNYEQTVAAKIIDAIREAAIDDLPHYNDACRIAWSFTLDKATADQLA